MRSHAKQLTIIQDNHFQNQILEITKLIRIEIIKTIGSGKYKTGFALINKEFERSLIMQTGWRIRIQLLRRGIVCLIKILKQYSRDGNKQESSLNLVRKLQQFLLFYVEMLNNQAKEYKKFYLKDILYRFSQIQLLTFQLSKQHEDVRCVLYWKPICYNKDSRFNKLKFQYNLLVGHLHFQFKLFKPAINYYYEAITECQFLLADIINQDYHLKNLEDQYFKVISWIVFTLYIVGFIYELQSDYNRLLETYKIAVWLSKITNNNGLSTFIEEQYIRYSNQYKQFMIESKELNSILAPIFPQSNHKDVEIISNDYWTKINDGFYGKYNKEINLQVYSILQQPEESVCNNKKQVRLTEQETTIQSYIHTPRQYEKCRTINSLDDVKISKQTTNNPSPQHSHRTPVLTHQKSKSFRFTTDIDQILMRVPHREIENFSSLKAKKELDSYYQQKVLTSFQGENQIKSLKSVKQQINSQEEIDKVCQSDLIVGKKLLKFQKYTHQRVATHSNIMKIVSDISKEQEHLEGINKARLAIQGSHDIENKMRLEIQQIIKKKSIYNEGELMNLKSLVSDYEQNLSKQTTIHEQPAEQSQISKRLREKNNLIIKSIDQTIKRVPLEQLKTRKSFLSRVQESMLNK